jgi:carboxypeptidase Taq
LRDWLGSNVHRYGRTYPPRELVRRATGSAIRVEPFLDYLNAKLRPIYGLDS